MATMGFAIVVLPRFAERNLEVVAVGVLGCPIGNLVGGFATSPDFQPPEKSRRPEGPTVWR